MEKIEGYKLSDGRIIQNKKEAIVENTKELQEILDILK